jgi:hypothetical protein
MGIYVHTAININIYRRQRGGMKKNKIIVIVGILPRIYVIELSLRLENSSSTYRTYG